MSGILETTNPPFFAGPTKFGSVGRVHVGRYGIGGPLALVLVDPENGEQILIATVNMVHNPLEDRRSVWMKGWSENEGVPKAFVDAGVIELTGNVVTAGYAFAEKARLTDRFYASLPSKVRDWIEQQ